MTFRSVSIEERLWGKVVKAGPNECWMWTGASLPKGYGLIQKDGRNTTVHRVAYELEVGTIPAGHQVDHLCRTPGCCNPAHLEAVTPRENTLRGNGHTAINARKTHCPRGHEYDIVTSQGYRWCSICQKAGSRL